MLYAFGVDLEPSFAPTNICACPLDVAGLVGGVSCDRWLLCCSLGWGYRTMRDTEISP